nr:penicillin-binding transpeptidase domain-containing protein [Sporosalibacterium faouarense]
MLLAVSVVVFGLMMRLGYIQIVRGQGLKDEALEQWAKDIPIGPKRGAIYDRNGKELAVSISSYQVDCIPADVNEPERSAEIISTILDLDKEDVLSDLTKRQSIVKIKRWISDEEADELREADLDGIVIVPDNKRYYPYGNFASYILGFTDYDNKGLYGVERTYDKYLTGTPGRLIKNTDSLGRQLPGDVERLVEPESGLNAVLTIDETIQHIAEKAALEAQVKNKAKRTAVIIMEPKTGNVLAMSTKPDFDPNNPREPVTEEQKQEWAQLSQEQLIKEWNSIWRPYTISDNYEPGSTFKIITAAAGLEEGVVTKDSTFHCDGYVRQVKSPKPIKCWRYYNPHGTQTFVEGAENSCNEVFVEVGLRLGKDKMYEYVREFGFGDKTGIDLTSEAYGLVIRPEYIKEVNLATMSFGQGIAVTPIQLVTAMSAVANGGELMEPRIVKELRDQNGELVHEFKPEVKKRVISKETSDTMMEILRSVVDNGTGGNAYTAGYRVGGKTGTAQKVVDGRYASGKYIASFAAIAPTDDPEIAVLVIIDEPSTGVYYGGLIAAPVAGEVVKETLDYLDVELKYTAEELEEELKKKVIVPDVTGKDLNEAAEMLAGQGFKYTTQESGAKGSLIIVDQFPKANTEVNKGSKIELYTQDKVEVEDTIIVPNLKGQSPEKVIETLNEMNLRFKFNGNGLVMDQVPKPGTEVKFNSLIEVEFQKRDW